MQTREGEVYQTTIVICCYIAKLHYYGVQVNAKPKCLTELILRIHGTFTLIQMPLSGEWNELTNARANE